MPDPGDAGRAVEPGPGANGYAGRPGYARACPAGLLRRPVAVERREPVHGLVRRGSHRTRVAERRRPAGSRGGGDLDLRVLHTSVLTVPSARVPGLDVAGRSWLPVGALAAQRAPLRRPPGQDKKETRPVRGAQVKEWRRSYASAAAGRSREEHHRRAIPVTGRAAEVLPRTECWPTWWRGPSPTGRTPSCPTPGRRGTGRCGAGDGVVADAVMCLRRAQAVTCRHTSTDLPCPSAEVGHDGSCQ